MRVKIQHSVSIDDVEEKVADLLSDSMSHLHNARATSGDLLTLIGIKASHHKQKMVLDLIHKVREQLSSYDAVLGDISNIVEGLHNYYESLNEPPEVSPEKVQEVVDNITERFSNMPKDEKNVNEG
jgi:hypothetical protein